MSESKIKVGITHGDINGIGYEVILKALDDPRITELLTPVVYGSPNLMSYYRKAVTLPNPLQIVNVASAADAKPDTISLVSVVDSDIKVEPGVRSKEAGAMALKALEAAVIDLKSGLIDALVTAPIDKDMIQCDTFPFPGHTEYLESSLGESNSKALMILASKDIRVALVTAHKPLAKVAEAVTAESVLEKLRSFNASLIQDFSITCPRIAVLALNPHAGENGLLGSEEQQSIVPAIEAARTEGIFGFGPYPADGFFGAAMWKNFDGVLAMYHDQGLAPFKQMAMESGVNITAGLPYVRTSPDHGTAFDIAGKDQACPDSMRAAMYAAVDIVRSRRNHFEATANPLKKQLPDRPRKGRQDKEEQLPEPLKEEI